MKCPKLKTLVIASLFTTIALHGAQDAQTAISASQAAIIAKQQLTHENSSIRNESPNKGYGLQFLPAVWSLAAYNPYKAMLFGGAALCTTGCILYCGLRDNPYNTAKIAAATLVLTSAIWAYQTPPNPYFLNLEEYMLTAAKLKFPAGFLFSTGGSSYQIEGCGPNNGGDDTSTYTVEYRNTLLASFTDPQGKDKNEIDRLNKIFSDTFAIDSNTNQPTAVGVACDEWNLYAQDTELKAKMGINADRFSIERFKVEPQKGEFNATAIQHYCNKAINLVTNNIRPIIGMHHYTDPEWFLADGGFEIAANLDGFATYCATITGAIYDACMQVIGQDQTKKHLIPLFYTYNSANAYAINGYQQGARPPYVKNMGRSRAVLFNLLDAHVRAYKKMKVAAPLAKIGTTINVYQLDPVNYLNPAHRTLCFAGNYLQNYSVYDFFKEFKKRAKPGEACLDWVGLNYYSHGYMKSPKGPFSSPADVTTTPIMRELKPEELALSKFATANKLYTIYADGLFLALHEINDNVAKLFNIPILITETGLGVERIEAVANADGYDALEIQQEIEKRDLFLKHYLYAASQACQVGIPLVGISIWSFMDNYEWGHYDKRYGLFGVDFSNPEKTRLRRKGAQYYWDAIKNHQTADKKINL